MKRNCVVCGSIFSAIPSRTNAQYCSIQCLKMAYRQKSDETFEKRFWARVEKTANCWLWIAGKAGDYGHLMKYNHSRLAHRISYEMAYGPIPDHLWVLHTCDNPACVRPDHLYLGGPKENMRDVIARTPGRCIPAMNAHKTHCVHGHPFTLENTRIRRGNQRECLTCYRQAQVKRNEKRRLERAIKLGIAS